MFLKDGASEAGSGTESELANQDEDTKEELETNMVSYLFVFCYICQGGLSWCAVYGRLPLNGHLELVSSFLYSLFLTL